MPVSNRVMLTNKCPFTDAYLEKQLGMRAGATLSMMLFGDVRFALYTNNIPLADVPQALTGGLLTEKILLLNRTLKEDFGVIKPRIAVLSLNPNAGAGQNEREEDGIITPAMNEAGKQNCLVFGPYSTDSFFGSRMYKKFDGVMAMYHDQIAGACKAIFENTGIYYTAGLPIIHTAPAHGAAYDITGQNLAVDDAFRNAIYSVTDIYRSRASYREATANPLRKYYCNKDMADETIDLTQDDDEILITH
jgi:4-hydroxythreonine-4-phosphate dehydrogenase